MNLTFENRFEELLVNKCEEMCKRSELAEWGTPPLVQHSVLFVRFCLASMLEYHIRVTHPKATKTAALKMDCKIGSAFIHATSTASQRENSKEINEFLGYCKVGGAEMENNLALRRLFWRDGGVGLSSAFSDERFHISAPPRQPPPPFTEHGLRDMGRVIP